MPGTPSPPAATGIIKATSFRGLAPQGALAPLLLMPPPPPYSGPAAGFASKLNRWGGLAKLVHAKVSGDAACKTAQWPCLKLYLTGSCGTNGCKACAGATKGKGDQVARAVAKAALAELADRVDDTLKPEIARGERERA